jgi:chromosome segregation ATPase
MEFKRAITHLNTDLEYARTQLHNAERAVSYHMDEIVREQKKIEACKLDIQSISEEIWWLQQMQKARG